MRYIFSILFCVILQTGFSQIYKTVGISYTNTTPTYTPAKAGSWLALDTVTWKYYTYNGSTWLSDGYRIQTISGCSAPAYTPTKFQSLLVINACTAGQGGPELYFWTGLVWLQINEGQAYTAGTGIAISGSNEISNTAPDQTVVLNEGAGIDVTGTYPNFTLASTITQGLTSLNSQTGSTQTFATGTTGTDFGISSAANTHTFNIPNSSAANRGLLTSADWSTFNGKIGGSGVAARAAFFSGASQLSSSADFLWDDVSKKLSIGSGGVNTSSLDITTTKSGITSTITPTASSGMFLGQSIAINTTGLTGTSGYTGFYVNRTGTAPSGSSYFFRFQNNTSDVFAANHLAEISHVPSGLSGFSSYQYNGTNTSAQYGFFRGTNSMTGISLRNALTTDNGTGIGFRFSVTTNSAYTPVSNTGAKVLVVGNGQAPATDVAHIKASGESYFAGNVGAATASPTSGVDITGISGYLQLRLRTTYTPTSTADALGSTGDTAWDENYFYIKTAAGWKRTALSTF